MKGFLGVRYNYQFILSSREAQLFYANIGTKSPKGGLKRLKDKVKLNSFLLMIDDPAKSYYFHYFLVFINLTPCPPLLVRRGGNSFLAMYLPSPG